MASRTFESLKRNCDFLDLKKNGRRFWASSWILFNFKNEKEEKTRLGLTVSRKIGNAVIRNRLKRWSKEITKNHIVKGDVFHGDINVIFKPMPKDFYKNLKFGEFQAAYSQGWRYLTKRK